MTVGSTPLSARMEDMDLDQVPPQDKYAHSMGLDQCATTNGDSKTICERCVGDRILQSAIYDNECRHGLLSLGWMDPPPPPSGNIHKTTLYFVAVL
jgi:hypothetical protein